MKQIEPVVFPLNLGTATILNAYAVNVILNTNATFYYCLLNSNQELLTNGNLIMTGEAYTQWQTDNYAWDWIADQLKLTIIGDYVPPVTE